MNWNSFSFDLTLQKEGMQFLANYKGESVLECCLENGMLDVSIKYDFMDKPPLHLSAAAHCGDKVKMNILPYRLELYVNDVLLDEEWPCGDHYLKECSIFDNGCDFRMQEHCISKVKEPDVLGVFQ